MTLPGGSTKPSKPSSPRGLRLALLAMAIALTAAAETARATTQPIPRSSVTVTGTAIRTVPNSFMGLSINAEEMQDFTNQPAFPQFIKLITPAGEGPFVLRVGGTFADTAYWNGEQEHVQPQYVGPLADDFDESQSFLDSLAKVLAATGSDAILNVNAAAHDPQMALDLLEAAERTLPSGSLVAAAIGNEPNLYPQGYDGITKSLAAWVRNFNPHRYDTLYALYATLLKLHLPGLTLAGPELGVPTTPWLQSLLTEDHGQVGLATEHYYAYSSCAAPHTQSYPILQKYFRITSVTQAAAQIQQAAALAHSYGLSYRLTELGSSTCQGLAPVTNAFATSLWGLDELYQLVADGIDGVNFHLRANEPNTALQATASGLTAEPLLYGIAAFARGLGPNAQLNQVAGTLPSNVAVWAVQSSNGWSLSLINDTDQIQSVRVTMPTSLPMTVSALTAPSPGALSASFGGQTIGSDGTWQGSPRTQTVTPVSGAYWFTIPPDSAQVASTG